MDKTLVVQLKTRMEQVTRRLEALNKEKDLLAKESTSLAELIPIYESFIENYDPMEVEKRMTALIHNLPVAPINHANTIMKRNQTGRKGLSKYDEILQIVFAESEHPLTPKDIADKMEALGEDINIKNVYNIVYRSLNNGKLTATQPGHFVWRGN